jgi:hypothetical protein
MKHIIIIILVALLTVGCVVNQNKITGVIFSNNIYLPYSVDGKPDGGWQPSEDIVKQAEPVILQYIEKSNKKNFGKPNKYRCQYFGVIIKGEKRIYCNFFWLTEYKKDWETNPVIVKDGGDRYFQLEYDVQTGKCLNFSVNGEA